MRPSRLENSNVTPECEPTPVVPLDVNAPLLDDDAPLPDWLELGRRVMNEAMRRTARELRRRNGCSSYLGQTHNRMGGNS